MYVAGPHGVGAKIVSLDPAVQASAGLGDIDVFDLDVGDLAPCANTPTGEPCRGMEAGGILQHCTCINFSDTDTLLELKQMVSDASGRTTTLAGVWTQADEAALLAWADEDSGFFLPDVQRWWRSGYVSVDDLVQRTQSGWAYPTGPGVLALADRAGCLQDGDRGLEVGPGCGRFPRVRKALERLLSVIHGAPEEGLAVYPPLFGATSQADPPQIEPGGVTPTEDTLNVLVPVAGGVQVHWLVWSAAGAAAAAAAWGLSRKLGYV